MTNRHPSAKNAAAVVDGVLNAIKDAGLEPSVDRNSHRPRHPPELFDELVTNQSLRDAAKSLFRDGHYARAVEDAFKCLNSAVREKSGLAGRDGADLMRAALSPNDPFLKLNGGKSQSDLNEQRGYMEMFAGVMTGIRNPRAHDHEIIDDSETALEMLVIANHLMRKVEEAQVPK